MNAIITHPYGIQLWWENPLVFAFYRSPIKRILARMNRCSHCSALRLPTSLCSRSNPNENPFKLKWIEVEAQRTTAREEIASIDRNQKPLEAMRRCLAWFFGYWPVNWIEHHIANVHGVNLADKTKSNEYARFSAPLFGANGPVRHSSSAARFILTPYSEWNYPTKWMCSTRPQHINESYSVSFPHLSLVRRVCVCVCSWGSRNMLNRWFSTSIDINHRFIISSRMLWVGLLMLQVANGEVEKKWWKLEVLDMDKTFQRATAENRSTLNIERLHTSRQLSVGATKCSKWNCLETADERESVSWSESALMPTYLQAAQKLCHSSSASLSTGYTLGDMRFDDWLHQLACSHDAMIRFSIHSAQKTLFSITCKPCALEFIKKFKFARHKNREKWSVIRWGGVQRNKFNWAVHRMVWLASVMGQHSGDFLRWLVFCVFL